MVNNMSDISTEELKDAKNREALYNEIDAMYELLGIIKREHSISVKFGENNVKCSLMKMSDNSIEARIYLDEPEYKVDEVRLERDVFFRSSGRCVVYTNRLVENTRLKALGDPQFITESLETYSLDRIDFYKFTGKRELILNCEYADYIELFDYENISIKALNDRSIKRVIINLNYERIDYISISPYRRSRFFSHIQELEKVSKYLGWDDIPKISISGKYINIFGVRNGKNMNRACSKTPNSEEEKGLLKLILDYLEEELKRHFAKYGVEVTVVWLDMNNL